MKVFQNVYNDIKSVVKLGNKTSEPFTANKGLWQGCCFPPNAFQYICCHSFNKLENKIGIQIDNDTCLHVTQTGK